MSIQVFISISVMIAFVVIRAIVEHKEGLAK